MGPRTDRITREVFVTPPEFGGLQATCDPASRVGGAQIELYRQGEETRLGYCFQQIPVNVMPPFQFESEAASFLYLINMTAGLMDGDAHLLEVTARSGARAMITGQSATRIHPALSGFATQQWSVDVEDDACLVVLPGPAIPYRGCRYFQRGRVSLAPSARLIWGDIWLAGRYDRGTLSERFVFDRIVQDFQVRRGERLVYRERFSWNGPWDADDAAWHFGGHMACASLFLAGPPPAKLPEPIGGVQRCLFPLESGDHCVRWCGHPTDVTADLVLTALQTAATWTTGPDAPPWFLHSRGLAPNHWFSLPD